MTLATDHIKTIDQDHLVSFLSSPAAYRSPKTVERVDTHISHIFLVGDRAYKLKRAVKFEFLDFSTPQLREQACRRELEINRRYAPDLYVRVVPVTLSRKGSFEIDGAGKPVDWLVEMVRFDGAIQLDVLASERRLTAGMMSDLADLIAAIHRTAPRSRRHGGYEDIRGISVYIGRTLGDSPPDHIDPEVLSHWKKAFRHAVRRHARQLERRKRHGYVRQCHADLHLANLVLWHGRPLPFDAIEFNDDISWVDVLYDIGFTVMDVLYYQERGLANLLLNRYLEVTRDYSGTALLSLFMSLRAAIRAMATSFGDDPKSIEAAQSYLKLACDLLAPGTGPHLFAVGGVSGTGKSTLARSLAVDVAPGAGAIVLNSDAIRKRLFGVPLEAKLDDAAYAPEVSERVYRRLMCDARRALLAEQTVIADATFLDDKAREALQGLASRLDLPLIGLWLEAPRDVLKRRLDERRGDVSDAGFAVAERQMSHVTAPANWHAIDSSGGHEQSHARALAAIGA